MSDEEQPEGRWIDPSNLPGCQRYYIGVVAVMQAPDDPEHTLTVALTHQDLTTIIFANHLAWMMFPELTGPVQSLNVKLAELSDYQGFLPTPPSAEEE